MNDFKIDRDRVRRNFAAAASGYDEFDVLQRAVRAELMDRLDFYLETPQRVADVGCATGRGAELLRTRYPQAEVLAFDFAVPMLRQAQKRSRWRRRFSCVAAEASQLPLPKDSVDVLFANLLLPCFDNLPRMFGEWMRVLRPGGYLAFTTFGPDTLRELRAAWAEVDPNPRVLPFLDMHDLGDAMTAAGWREPVLDITRYTLTYAEPMALVRELKGMGATQVDAARLRGLTSPRRFQAMLAAYEKMRVDGRIPATAEVITAHAWGPVSWLADAYAKRGGVG